MNFVALDSPLFVVRILMEDYFFKFLVLLIGFCWSEAVQLFSFSVRAYDELMLHSSILDVSYFFFLFLFYCHFVRSFFTCSYLFFLEILG